MLTIMTYNIKHGAGMDDFWDISRPIAVAKKVRPDVLCLQEVDRFTGRSFGADEPAMMGHILRPLYHWQFVKSLDFNGGEYGNAILSCAEPSDVKRYAFPGLHEQRTMIQCDFGDYAVCTAHLSLHDEFRMKSAETFAEIAATCDKPVFFTGDWNATPDSEFIKAVSKDLVFLSDISVFTCHAAAPNMCIDYIAVDRRHASSLRLISAEVLNEPEASDHRPVVVKVELG